MRLCSPFTYNSRLLTLPGIKALSQYSPIFFRHILDPQVGNLSVIIFGVAGKPDSLAVPERYHDLKRYGAPRGRPVNSGCSQAGKRKKRLRFPYQYADLVDSSESKIIELKRSRGDIIFIQLDRQGF